MAVSFSDFHFSLRPVREGSLPANNNFIELFFMCMYKHDDLVYQ